MTSFELTYAVLAWFLPPLHRQVGGQLKKLSAHSERSPEILDIGGRKSHYTIGIPARITIADLPRESEVQEELNLGINDEIMRQTLSRRSNVARVIYDDMSKSRLPDNSFDGVVAVEVLEHVEEDNAFVKNVCRVLRPGGWFLMTTPNGDAVPIPHNIDHKRHYRRSQLQQLLSQHLDMVDIVYAIKPGIFRSWGLKSWSIMHPVQTGRSMLGNVINSFQSAGTSVKEQAYGTRHLIAIARKPLI